MPMFVFRPAVWLRCLSLTSPINVCSLLVIGNGSEEERREEILLLLLLLLRLLLLLLEKKPRVLRSFLFSSFQTALCLLVQGVLEEEEEDSPLFSLRNNRHVRTINSKIINATKLLALAVTRLTYGFGAW